VNRPAVPVPSRDEGILRCSVGAEQYAFRTIDVRHLARAEQVRDDAKADGRLGVLKFAGLAVPVFGLGHALGRPRPTTVPRNSDQHVAVTGGRDGLVGWLVDKIARTASLPREAVAPMPRSVGLPASKWFEALVTFGPDDSALLIAPEHLNPLVSIGVEADIAPAFAAPPVRAGEKREVVAVLFSTDSLPPSPAGRYALSGRQVAAVVQPAAPIHVPGAAPHVIGVTRWRQAVVPIVEFRHTQQRSPSDGRRLIAQTGPGGAESLVAFSINTEVVMHRPEANHSLIANAACPPFCSGMFDVDGEVVGLLDLEALLREPS
jgi:chemotaxis signal transduction protein